MFKNISIILVTIITFSGCCNGGSEPEPPNGSPDETSRYTGSDGYQSIDYTYYCLGGQYVSYTYIKEDKCASYELDSKYTSSGICSNQKLMKKIKSVPPEKKNKILEKNGINVDTVFYHSAPSGKSIFN